MEEDFKRLMQKLADLDKKTQEIDQILKDVRMGIHNLFWDLNNLKKSIIPPTS